MTAPTPPITASLAARYRASELGVASGARVTSWADLSGNGRTLTSATGPVYRPTGLNGFPACEFAAVAGEKLAAGSAWFPKPHTIYGVIKADALANTWWGSASGFTSEVLLGVGVSATFRLVGTYDGTARGGIAAEIVPTVQGVMADGTNVYNLWRSTAKGYVQPGNLVTSGAFSGAGPGTFRIGGKSAAGNEWDGMVAEVLIYSAAHEINQIAQMVGWLSAQYLIGPYSAQEFGGVDAAITTLPDAGRLWPRP